MSSANLRSAILGNTPRPRVTAPYEQTHGRGIPSYSKPLEHSIKPLPTLPYIVGNSTYDPTRFERPYETMGTSFLRGKLNKRSVLPTLSQATGEPSNSNPTIL
jgi:hypothetical protein